MCFWYFLLKAQTKSLLVTVDHKFQVMIVTNDKYIVPGSGSTMPPYKVNYLGCAEHFLLTGPRGRSTYRPQRAWLESAHNLGLGSITKESDAH